MKLYEIEDCDECPIRDEGICPGGWTSGAGGDPIEPPCTNWDGNKNVRDYIEEFYASQLEYEEYEDRLFEEKQKKQRKKEISKRKREYIKGYCISEQIAVKTLKRKIKNYENIEHLADCMATAFNITNEMFGYSDRKEVNPEISEALQTLKAELEKAEKDLKDKQNECRNTEYYKNIGKDL